MDDDTWVPSEGVLGGGDTSGGFMLPGADGDVVVDNTIPAGSVLGAYRLIEILGSGGMGHVWRAEHVRLGRQVALKMLRRRCAQDPQLVGHFFAEARAVSSLKHENIVDVTDFIELPEGSAFVMELLHGKSLGTAMKLERFSLARIVNIATQVASAMEVVHAASIVHRDLKPDNIFLVDDDDGERVKLLDFGVAKLAAKERALETRAGALLGTPEYMAPEQLLAEHVDGRADIYALGVVLYELACGMRPFNGESLGALAIQHSTQKAAPLPLSTDRRLAALVMRCLAKDPAERPPTMAAVSAALADITPSPETQPILVAPDDDDVADSAPPRSRARIALAAGAVVAVAAVAAVVALGAGVFTRATAPSTATTTVSPAPTVPTPPAPTAPTQPATAAPAPAAPTAPATATAAPTAASPMTTTTVPNVAMPVTEARARAAAKKRAREVTDATPRTTILDPFATP